MKKRNEMYEAPYMEVVEFEVESGIAQSPYGLAGEAGQGSGFIDYGEGDDFYL